MNPPDSKVGFSSSLAYGLPVLVSSMLLSPLGIIQGIYAKHYGLALTTLAFVIFLSRIIDAISDPLVGYLSDRYWQKHGTRKPFIVVGGLLLIVCSYFFFLPPTNVSTTYYAFWLVALYTAYTIFEIPHVSWPRDITQRSDHRAKLYSFRVMAGYTGSVLFYSIPLLPFFATQDITPETLKVTFGVALVLALPLWAYCLYGVPNGPKPLASTFIPSTSRFSRLRLVLKELIGNKPFLIILIAFTFFTIGANMWYGLIYIYVDTYLEMGEQFAKMFLIAFLFGIVCAPLWYKIIVMIGQKKAWMLASILMIVSFILTGFLQPGNVTFYQLLLLKTIQTSSFVGVTVLLPTLLSETIDYIHWKSNSELSALYFSSKVFLEKTGVALGFAGGLAIAGWFGLDMNSPEQTSNSILGLKIAMVYIPILSLVISLIFIALYPLNEKRHNIIRKRLEQRLARKNRDAKPQPECSEKKSQREFDRRQRLTSNTVEVQS
jgi:Na+/melibiose symporter-like transporter